MTPPKRPEPGRLGGFGLIGAGAFGTALAQVCLQARQPGKGQPEKDQPEKERPKNEKDGPPVTLLVRQLKETKPTVRHTLNPADLSSCGLLVYAARAQAFPEVLSRLIGAGLADKPMLIAAKGILTSRTGAGSLREPALLHQYAAAAGWVGGLGVLSGPGFASDICGEKPFAVTIAADGLMQARWFCSAIATPFFRPYASDDPVGVAVGGAVKNVIAVSCGIATGMNLGESSRAALMTRGLAEMSRFGVALGARKETFLGLSGVGDLALSCTSQQSRNYRFGMAIGRGGNPADAERDIGTVEGISTARAVVGLAGPLGVELPIAAQLLQVLEGQASTADGMANLLRRATGCE